MLTNKEAIELLEIDLEDYEKEFEATGHFKDDVDCLKLAIQAMKKVEADKDGEDKVVYCGFCSSGNLYNDPIAESSPEVCGITLFNAEVFIAYGNKLKLHLSNSNDDFIGGTCSKINYCPICGRKLEPTVKDVMDEIYDTNPEEYDRIMNRLSGGEEE